MELNSTKYPNNSRTVSGTPTIYRDDVVLLCDTSSAPVVINLLEIPDDHWNTNWKLYIVDESNNAGTNNITINAGSGQLINNAASLTISTNNGYCVVRINANDRYVAELSNQVAAPASIAVQNDSVVKTNPTSVINFSGDFLVTGVGTTAIVQLYDSGWHDLYGFDHYTGTMAAYKPQARRIGHVIYFRGVVVVPLDNPSSPGNVVNMNEIKDYYGVAGKLPFTGSGGVSISYNGSIVFNNDANIIPPAVAPLGIPLDGAGYTLGIITGIRNIEVDYDGVSPDTWHTQLTAPFAVTISFQKKLYVTTLYAMEQGDGVTVNGVIGNSPLRYIASRVTAGQYLNAFSNPASNIHGSPVSGPQTLNIETDLYGTGYPTPPSLQGNFLYPFSVDASYPDQIGGFLFYLDTLRAFIADPP